jgi:hypothetical protein
MSFVIGAFFGCILSAIMIGWHHKEDCNICNEKIKLREQNEFLRAEIKKYTIKERDYII